MRNSFDQIFLTNLAVILVYPRGAGGKFITNCLSFHPRFHPQSSVFLKDNDSRIAHILTALDQYDGNEWNDLDMGCRQFFGVPALMPDSFDHNDVIAHRLEIKEKSMSLLLPVLSSGLHFFKTAHTTSQHRFYSAIWPNSKKIIMDNCSGFITGRNGDWRVADNIKDVLENDDFVFDARSLFDWHAFLDEYIRLLAWFNEIPDNLDRLKIFYDKYITAVCK